MQPGVVLSASSTDLKVRAYCTIVYECGKVTINGLASGSVQHASPLQQLERTLQVVQIEMCIRDSISAILAHMKRLALKAMSDE